MSRIDNEEFMDWYKAVMDNAEHSDYLDALNCIIDGVENNNNDINLDVELIMDALRIAHDCTIYNIEV